ncbi:ribosomal RNA-processing protein 7-domain-containing protein [Tricladium varicosporioides]|nr:ribosomal RNA-processing protein 7-domain-containing protein [Hymenoscyphus varicosporioides]
MAPTQATIKDYTILPILLLSLPVLSLPSPATHTLYLRPHAPKIPTEVDERSLFLVNVPIDSTASHFRAVFAHLLGGAGKVEDVIFEGEKRNISSALVEFKNSTTKDANKGKKRKRGQDEDLEAPGLPEVWDRKLHRSGGTAVVVFVDLKSVEAVLRAVKKLHKSGKESKYPVWGKGLEDKVEKLGSARYATHHALRYPDTKTLQQNVDMFMTVFNSKEERKKREEKRGRNVPDEDGFVTVTRGGRVGPARREDAEEKKREMEEREEKKRKEREGEGFYRFQVRERRKMEQGELVRQFEEDKKRVEKLRASKGKRGIRPEN